MKPDPVAIALLSHSLQDGSPASLPALAAGTGAREIKRLSWTSGTYDELVMGKPAQGFFLLNDGLTDARINTAPSGTITASLEPLLTLRPGEWIALPVESQTLYSGHPDDDGTLFLLAFDYAPTPAMGSLWTSGPDAIVASFDDTSAGELIAPRNPRRVELVIVNNTGDTVFLLYGGAPGDVDSTNFSWILPDGATLIETVFTGDVQAWQAVGAPSLQVTEVSQ